MNPIDQNNGNQDAESISQDGAIWGLVVIISCLVPFFIIGRYYNWWTGLGTFVLYAFMLLAGMRLLERFDGNSLFSFSLFAFGISPFIYAIYLTGYAKEIAYGVLMLLAALSLYYFIKAFWDARTNRKNEDRNSPRDIFIKLLLLLLFIGPALVIGIHHHWLTGLLTPIGLILLVYNLFRLYQKFDAPIVQQILMISILTLVFTPFFYALYLLFNLEIIGGFLIVAALSFAILFRKNNQKTLELFEAKLNWPQLRIPFPEEAARISLPVFGKAIRWEDQEEITTTSVQIAFDITYQVNDVAFTKELFIYTWFAPEEDPKKIFDYDLECKGQHFDLCYDPTDPNSLSIIITKANIINIKARNAYYSKKASLIFITIALIGLILVGIGLSSPF